MTSTLGAMQYPRVRDAATVLRPAANSCFSFFALVQPTSYTVNPLISCRPTEYVGLHHVVRLTIKPALSWPGSCSILPCR